MLWSLPELKKVREVCGFLVGKLYIERARHPGLLAWKEAVGEGGRRRREGGKGPIEFLTVGGKLAHGARTTLLRVAGVGVVNLKSTSHSLSQFRQ